MGEEEIENLPLRDIFRHIWSVKLFLYEFRSTYFPILKSKELPSQKRDGSSCLKGILGGNHQFARAKMIAVGQCTDAAIDGFHIILLVEKVSKLC